MVYVLLGVSNWSHLLYKEKFEDIKVVIRNRISKKNRQHNGQKKKYKRTNNDLQNIHIKTRRLYKKTREKRALHKTKQKKEFILKYKR